MVFGISGTDIDIEKTLEVLRWMRYEVLSVGAENTPISVVDVGIFQLFTGRGVDLDTFGSDSLPGSESEGTGLDRICGRNELGRLLSVIRSEAHVGQPIWGSYICICLRNVGVRVGILEGLFSWVQGPSRDVDLLSKRCSICLHEWVHVLPAVQMSHAADFSVHNRLCGVASSIAKHKALYVSSADFATMVDDLSSWVDHNLGGIQTGEIDLGVAKRDVDLVGARSFANTAHLIGVGRETVLPVLLEQWKTLLVVNLPSPVRITGNPYIILSVNGPSFSVLRHLQSSGKAMSLQPAFPASSIQ